MSTVPQFDLLPFMSHLKLSLKCDTKGLSCQTMSVRNDEGNLQPALQFSHY